MVFGFTIKSQSLLHVKFNLVYCNQISTIFTHNKYTNISGMVDIFKR